MAPGKQVSKPTDPEVVNRVALRILDVVAAVPTTDFRRRSVPDEPARAQINKAAARAAVTAGTLALPPGPVGWLTILPEIYAVWRIQAQLVSDVAGLYGRKGTLTQEQMIYCLFRHMAAQAMRDLMVRVGERVLVRRATLAVMQGVAKKVGIRLTQRSLGRAVSRWLPLIGAVGVGGYAYYDTVQVGQTAMELFSTDIQVKRGTEDS